MDEPKRFLTRNEVYACHAQFGKVNREDVKAGMGPNWPREWDDIPDGEGIFESRCEAEESERRVAEMKEAPAQGRGSEGG
jgi:hypothetical protein